MVVSGCVGPRGDGYDPGTVMSADEAQAYHAEQIGVFAEQPSADMVTAITMTNANEAIGVTRAAQAAGMPVRDLLHGRDRRPAADRPEPAGGDRGGRRGDRQGRRPTT